MTTRLLALAVSVVLASSALAEEKQSDSQRMQGTWRVLALIDSGKAEAADAIEGDRFVVDGNTFRYLGDDEYHGTFTIDPTTREIDSKFSEYDDYGSETARGIYKFEGSRLCQLQV